MGKNSRQHIHVKFPGNSQREILGNHRCESIFLFTNKTVYVVLFLPTFVFQRLDTA